MIRTVPAILAAVLLTGCAVGQKFNYATTSIPLQVVPAASNVSVAVLDARPYVVAGKKKESFVGLSRGGYGNPFDVTTSGGGPLATDMSSALVGALGGSGRTVTPVAVKPADGVDGARRALAASGAQKSLLLTLREWKTDTMARTGLDYDVTLDVLDPSGRSLASKALSGKEVAGSAIMSAEKDAQRWFGDKVAQLLADPAVAAALGK